MLKVYVGARYSRKPEAKALAEMLTENGFEVTATWFNEPESPTIQLDEVSDATLIEYAKRDVAEIDAADVLILMSDPPREVHPRGGKHWETGYAAGKGKKIVVFGPVENIFHMLPGVIVTDKDFQLFAILRNIQYQARRDRKDVISTGTKADGSENFVKVMHATKPPVREELSDTFAPGMAHPGSSSGVHPMSGGGVIGYGLPPSGSSEVRGFAGGATRNAEGDKLDYEGFISPLVLERYGRYMHLHRRQRDGSLRDSDNWQKGIPQQVYMKSLVRHTLDFWRLSRGGNVVDPDTKKPASALDLACAVMFNIMGWMHEALKRSTPA